MANLRKGGAPGGVQPGQGRPPNVFRQMCQEICSSPQFFQFARDVFDDKPVSPKFTAAGEMKMAPASPMEKKALWEILAAYGYGKPIQPVDLEEGARVSLAQLVAQARLERQVPDEK
ncbi:MAG: hypothetical protein EKK55_17340 [Rhodocyclaceae bacterium]|nr:MAG: hypothetical protein EKK55_17340 [Rhodocyclaceae bacterium]